MKKKVVLIVFNTSYLYLLLLLFSANISFSQEDLNQRKVDSLESILPIESGEDRMKILHNLSIYSKNVDLKKGLYYARLLTKEIRLNPDSKLKAKSCCVIAEIFDQTGASSDSIKIMAQHCLELGERFEHKMSQGNALYRLGIYYKMKAEFEISLSYFHRAIEVSKEKNLQKTKANCLHALGVIKDFQSKYDEAIEYFNQSIEIGQLINNNDAIFIGLQSRAISKCMNGETDEGIKDFLKAKSYAKRIASKMNIRSNLSYAYTSLNKLDSAEYYLKEAYELCDKYGSTRQIIETSSALVGFQLKQKEWDKVYPILKERELLIIERQSKKWLRTNAKDFTYYYKETGDFKKALYYQSKFITYNDSILNEKNQFAIKEIEEKYENEKKQLLIEDQEITIKNKNTQRNSFLAIGLMGIAFLLHRIKKNKQLEKQNEIINLKEIDRLKKENTIMNLSSMLEGQHAERKRIAQDLHDGLGGLLSSAKLQLNNVKAEISKLEQMAVFSNAENLIDSAYKEVRRISHDMMPGALVNLGLFAAVEDLAQQINESGKLLVQTQWFTEDTNMNEKTKVSLYLIVQEAVTNAVKYAGANHLIIQLSDNDDHYQLTIEDDGKGFDSKDKSKHGLGLKNIQSRVDYLEGKWEIISTADEGVSLEISIPINPS